MTPEFLAAEQRFLRAGRNLSHAHDALMQTGKREPLPRKPELLAKAKRLGVKGLSRMTKAQLTKVIGAAAEPGLVVRA